MLMSNSILAQSLSVLDSIPFNPDVLTNDLHILATTTQLDEIKYLGKLKCEEFNLFKLYWDLHHKTTDFGANLYKITHSNFDTESKLWTVEWEIFYCSKETGDQNIKGLGYNQVFVLSNQNKPVKFNINGEKVMMDILTVHMYIATPETPIKVNSGGFSGHTVKYKYKNEKSNIFLVQGGGSVSPNVSSFGRIGVQVSTGSLQFLSSEYGYFLSEIFRPTH